MSLRPEPIGLIPAETTRVARAAFPKGHHCLRLRDELGPIYDDDRFASLFPAQGRPAEAPWRLALVTVLQFAEGLSDRQAADAVRDRLAWKYLLGLELTDTGFDFSIRSDFRARLVAGEAEQLLLDALLDRCKAAGLVRARGTQRTDSTAVLAAVRALNRLDLVGETLRHALEALAVAAPASGCGPRPRPTGTTATVPGSRPRGARSPPRSATRWRPPSAPMACGCCAPSTTRPLRPGCVRSPPSRPCAWSGCRTITRRTTPGRGRGCARRAISRPRPWRSSPPTTSTRASTPSGRPPGPATPST